MKKQRSGECAADVKLGPQKHRFVFWHKALVFHGHVSLRRTHAWQRQDRMCRCKWGSSGLLGMPALARNLRIAVVLIAHHTSCDERQLHAPNASTGTTSAFQQSHRTDNANEFAVKALRRGQNVFDAVVMRISWSRASA